MIDTKNLLRIFGAATISFASLVSSCNPQPFAYSNNQINVERIHDAYPQNSRIIYVRRGNDDDYHNDQTVGTLEKAVEIAESVEPTKMPVIQLGIGEFGSGEPITTKVTMEIYGQGREISRDRLEYYSAIKSPIIAQRYLGVNYLEISGVMKENGSDCSLKFLKDGSVDKCYFPNGNVILGDPLISKINDSLFVRDSKIVTENLNN